MPPSHEPQTRHGILLGYTSRDEPVRIPLRDLNGVITVYGMTGTGKTTLVASVLNQLAASFDHIGFTVFDIEGEYAKLLGNRVKVLRPGARGSERLSINLSSTSSSLEDLRSRQAKLDEFLRYVVESQGAELTPSMRKLLYEASLYIARGDVPITDIDAALERAARRYSVNDKTVQALQSRLHVISRYPLNEVLSQDNTLELDNNSYARKIVVDLHGIAEVDLNSATLATTLGILSIAFSAMQMPITRSVRHFIVVDEAEKVVPPSHPSGLVPELLGYQMRKRGVSSIIIAHSPSTINSTLRREASTIVAFRLIDKYDLDLLKAAMNLQEPSILSRLEKGQAAVSYPSGYLPVIFRTQPVTILGYAEEALLRSIEENPCLSIKERRALLGMSGSRFRDVVGRLRSLGLIEERSLYLDSGRPRKLLQKAGSNPSVVHECIIHYIENLLSSMGISTRTHSGVGPDIEAFIGGKRVAIEVETGSNVVGVKYRRLINNGYDYIIIVCSNRNLCVKRARNAIHGLPASVVYSGNISKKIIDIVEMLNRYSSDKVNNKGVY